MENLVNNQNSLLYYNLLAKLLLKNHDTTQNNPSDSGIQRILEQKQINFVLSSDPFLKAGFLSKLVQDTDQNILYLDLDLLYSGYVTSGILEPKKNVTLFQPDNITLNNALKEILAKASMSKSIIIVDSINGLYNLLNRKKDIGKVVTSIIMLLASIAHTTNSHVIVASMVRYKKEEGWILSPTGKRLIDTKNSKKILLEYDKDGIIISMLDNPTKLVIPSKLIPLV
jgi:hypothetical protein